MGELQFAFSGQLPRIILTGLFSRGHMKFGFGHQILDIFGAGVGDGKVFQPYALTHLFASHVVDGANDVPREIIAPVFKVQKHPVCFLFW